MSCIPEPAMQSCDTGQRIPFFDSFQLITIWMSNTKFYTDSIKVCHFPDTNMKGWAYVWMYSVRMIFSEPKFLGNIDYHIFLPMVLWWMWVKVNFFSATFAGPWFVEMQKFCYKGPGLISVTFFVELIIRRGSYIQCMKRLRKGENICVLFENPTHCSIGTAGRRNKCREDHGSYRCSSQSRNCVFNCNDLLCI